MKIQLPPRRSKEGGARRSAARARGFSMVELVTVVGIILILLAISLPFVMNAMKSYRVIGDARNVAGQLALARMDAAEGFTHAEVTFNLAAGTYQIQVWNKASSAYQAQGAVLSLAQGDTFGYGSITTGAGNPVQSPIAQTTTIPFDSRGTSLVSPAGTAAIYITNGNGIYCAVTVPLDGEPQTWQYTGSAWKGI